MKTSSAKKIENQWPGLSEKERDRRWKLVRGFMKEKELDCLVVFGLQSSAQPDIYLTNDQGGGTVIFPQQGESVYLMKNYFNVMGHWYDVQRGDSVWSTDVRAPTTGPAVVEVLKEKKCERSTIGIVGVNATYAATPEGHVSYNTYRHILDNLPHAHFREVSWEFNTLISVKSEEELNIIRHAAWIGEMCCQAMLDTARPGVGENEVYVAGVNQLLLHGSMVSLDNYTTPMIFHSGPFNPSWGPPRWLKRGQPPKILQKGDLILTEIFNVYAGLEAQCQLCIGLEPVDPVSKDCARLARESYEAGVKALVPGNTLAQVYAEMVQPLKKAGAYQLAPNIHSQNPQFVGGPTYMGTWESVLPDAKKYKRLRIEPGQSPRDTLSLIIQQNTTWELETNAAIGQHKVNIGGLVVANKGGAEVLFNLPTRMRTIG